MPLFFSLPKTLNGESITWLYSDPDCTLLKRGFGVQRGCVDHAGNTHVRYVLDFESRIPKRRENSALKDPIRNGFLVVWFKKPLDNISLRSTLRRVIDTVAMKRNSSIGSNTALSFYTQSLRHVHLHIVQRLERIFDVGE